VTADDTSEAPTTPTRPWCLFRTGGRGRGGAFAVGLESVAEVVEVERLVGMPHSPPRVLGLCPLRRELIPAISLDDPDGGGGPSPAPSNPSPHAGRGKMVMLILRSTQGAWAVRIAPEGTEIVDEPLDAVEAAGTGTGPTLLGVIRRDGAAHAVIDAEETWRNVRAGVTSWYTDHWSREAPGPGAGAAAGAGTEAGRRSNDEARPS
jgi:chemotaxis signal transduction protein